MSSTARRMLAWGCGTVVVAILLSGAHATKRWHDNYDFVQAAWVDDSVRVRRHLDAGIDPNVRGLKGLHAIQIAAQHGHTEVVRMLLDRGADPMDGIYNAIGTKRPAIVRMLIARGARVTVKPSDSIMTPLDAAHEQTDPEVRAIVEAAAKAEQGRQ